MAKDLYHEQVKRGLLKEGWTITHDPYPIKIGNVRLFIDLGAERVIAAEKGNEKIVVEIKSFSGDSPVAAFHEALGQYENYLIALEDKEPDRLLFLAVPTAIYDGFFQEPFIQKVVGRKNIKLIIYSTTDEPVLRWKQ